MNWAIVAGTILIATVATVMSGVKVSFPVVALTAVPLAACYGYYRLRRQSNFALCLSTLLQIVLFSSAFALLTYLGARSALPLVDDHLAAWDAALGFNVSRLVAWQADHPRIGSLLQHAYNSMFMQTAAVVVLLGFQGDRRLRLFAERMMIAGLVTLAVFLIMPAEGPFSVYGYTPSASQAHYLEHFRTLRSGIRNYMDFRDVEGLVTFPSFHTIWALLLTVAFLHLPIIRIFAAVLNAAVIVATMTTGWHYLSDVIAGVIVCAIVCVLVREKNPNTAEST